MGWEALSSWSRFLDHTVETPSGKSSFFQRPFTKVIESIKKVWKTYSSSHEHALKYGGKAVKIVGKWTKTVNKVGKCTKTTVKLIGRILIKKPARAIKKTWNKICGGGRR